jgi:hypothetical protein
MKFFEKQNVTWFDKLQCHTDDKFNMDSKFFEKLKCNME